MTHRRDRRETEICRTQNRENTFFINFSIWAATLFSAIDAEFGCPHALRSIRHSFCKICFTLFPITPITSHVEKIMFLHATEVVLLPRYPPFDISAVREWLAMRAGAR